MSGGREGKSSVTPTKTAGSPSASPLNKRGALNQGAWLVFFKRVPEPTLVLGVQKQEAGGVVADSGQGK